MKARCIALCEAHDVPSQQNSASVTRVAHNYLGSRRPPARRRFSSKKPPKIGGRELGFENHPLIGRSLPQIKFGQPQVHCSNESSRQHPLPLIDEAIYNTAPCTTGFSIPQIVEVSVSIRFSSCLPKLQYLSQTRHRRHSQSFQMGLEEG